MSTPCFAQSREPFFSGLGSHHRAVTTRSSAAQRFFDQGLAFVYAFNHDEAIRSFQAAAKADPNCPMAWWGIALASGPHINNPFVSPDREQQALVALARARSLLSRATPTESDLIRASFVRFSKGGPAQRQSCDQNYARAMRRVWARHGDDPDVGALFAESMMDLRPWDLWTNDKRPQPGTDEIVRTLDRVLVLDPNHPLGLHLKIHALEASPHPERADAAANRLRNLQPGLGHMVHMPSHIDVLTGRWHEAIRSNELAIRSDAAYRKIHPKQGFYNIYMTHNRHMLGFASMMVGDRARSYKAMDSVTAQMPAAWVRENAPMVDAYICTPLEVRVRFGDWDGVLKWPEYPEYLPFSRAIRHMARAVAYAAKGQVFEAEAEHQLFIEARRRVPAGATVGNSSAEQVLDMAEHLTQGEIDLAAGRTEEALRSLRQAVRAEGQLRYDEPPDWMIPTRHVLGVALLKAGKAREAELVYRDDLKRLPKNGWSLMGLSTALARQGKGSEAERARKEFERMCGTQSAITSSCLCVPHP